MVKMGPIAGTAAPTATRAENVASAPAMKVLLKIFSWSVEVFFPIPMTISATMLPVTLSFVA